MMPSVTVVVSSDTDIYISPGLYGDCLPTSATGGSADSFRAGPSRCGFLLPPSCSHMAPEGDSALWTSAWAPSVAVSDRPGPSSGPLRDSRHIDAIGIVNMT
ncbi:hypothetical protein GCM10010121_068420 [Streptomyces brasiliensis]|uniref:Uncharacterized protein n=1 Tax=Streptomyces brasiliensis TaxID=1954 RepID=A0A917L9A5_9ACTN|nr:hypothetical protein GCM10010121_068420 [Streptomyces brasiliensis]